MLSSKHASLTYYRQRMESKVWKKILLEEKDSIIFKGNVYKLLAKNIGYGVVEVFKDPEQLKKNGYME